MIHNEPKCPYCGTGMILERRCSMGMFYNCPNLKCLSASPYVRRKAGEDTEAICYEAALRRPIQKPLTLEELDALIDSGDEVVIYIETDTHVETYANIIYGMKIFDRYGETEGVDFLRFDTYGKTWRAWASRPTDEERAAAQWEE